MPKKKAVNFDVDKFLEETSENSESINDVAEEVQEEERRSVSSKAEVKDMSSEDDEVFIGIEEDRFADKLVTVEPDPEFEDAWRNEQEIDLGHYNARRIKTAREKEVKRIKQFQLENRKQIRNMMDSVHGEEPAEVRRDKDEKVLSKKSLIRAREEKRKAEKDKEDSIVDVMMKELLGTYRE